MITTLIISCAITLICFFLKDLPGKFFKNENVNTGFLLSLPGLTFFSLNKVGLSLLNGLRQMKSFAVFQALRYFLMLTALAALIILKAPGDYVSGILTISEFILFVLLNIYLIKYYKAGFSNETLKWSRLHFRFGSKAMIGNMMNTKVDVLVLGYFTDERIVGIYSFASSLADGFNQLPFVLRNNINPLLTKCFYKNGVKVLERVINKIKKSFYKIILVLGIIAISIYPFLVSILGFKQELAGSWIVFIILISGIVISGGYLPFLFIFNQTGRPGLQSLFLFTFFFTNLILNLILAPLLGMYGSAIASALTFVLQVFYMKKLVLKKLSIKV